MTASDLDPGAAYAHSPDDADRPAALTELVDNIGYEVMPFKSTDESVVKHVPTDVPLTVTITEAKGLIPTLELAERLRGRGYDVAPHLASRLFKDDDAVAYVAERLRAAGIERVFVVGGDAHAAAGEFPDALSLLECLKRIGHPFTDIGIGGYPEGHGRIPDDVVEQAVRDKAPYATRVVTQICFDPSTMASWSEGLMRHGVDLPIYVGMPGPVNRQKLIRISASIGLGQSARFLQKQQGMWRFLLPGAYNPSTLVRRVGRASSTSAGRIRGLHIFTFNELEGTEKWRRRLRAQVGLD